MSEEQAEKTLTGRARSLANLKHFPKGKSPNPGGKPKDLAKFGNILMKEFYKTVAANTVGGFV